MSNISLCVSRGERRLMSCGSRARLEGGRGGSGASRSPLARLGEAQGVQERGQLLQGFHGNSSPWSQHSPLTFILPALEMLGLNHPDPIQNLPLL